MHESCLCFFPFDILSNWCYVAIWAASLIGIFCFSGSLPLCFCYCVIPYVMFVWRINSLSLSLSLSPIAWLTPISLPKDEHRQRLEALRRRQRAPASVSEMEASPLSYELVDGFLTDVPGEEDWGEVMMDIIEYLDTDDNTAAIGSLRALLEELEETLSTRPTHNDPTGAAKVIEQQPVWSRRIIHGVNNRRQWLGWRRLGRDDGATTREAGGDVVGAASLIAVNHWPIGSHRVVNIACNDWLWRCITYCVDKLSCVCTTFVT